MKPIISFLLATVSGGFLSLSGWAQTASPSPATQIGPGSTGSISPAQGVTPTTGNKAQKILSGALTPQTRQTLQEAMNSVSAH